MPIQVEHLTHTYMPGSPFSAVALHDVSLTIDDGELIGLLGHTGSGKTTLVQHLNGLIKPTEGRVVVDGLDLTQKGVSLLEVRKKVGLVFQYPEYQLFEETVAKDIAFGPRNMGLDEAEIAHRVEVAAQFCGLPAEFMERSPFELSGGQKRRVAIAGVLAMQPRILVLDEPAAGLDPEGRDTILSQIKRFHKETGTTVVLVSHSMEDIAKYADRVLVMDQRKVAMFDTTAHVFAQAPRLLELGLSVPQITQIFLRLREMGLRARLNEKYMEWRRSVESSPPEIVAADVAGVITSMTGVPAERLKESDSARLNGLQSHLSSKVIGQDDAVERVSRIIRRSRAGLRDENRPMGVFLFVGPTGVGKTLLAKELSKWMFDGGDGLVRLDMSEYGERHNVARLTGSPPGYVGYGEGGQLTEAVRRRPYSVILLDEIEKAHPDVFDTMLQLLDEGRLTDGSGRTVDFRNTVIIMTSNAGSRDAAVRGSRAGYATPSKSEAEDMAAGDECRKALERTFSPEFLNRIDDIILFRELTETDVERIVETELGGLFSRMSKLGYGIRVTAGARRELAALGYERRYGARALKRVLADKVETPVSNMIIDGMLRSGDTIVVGKSRSGIVLKVA